MKRPPLPSGDSAICTGRMSQQPGQGVRAPTHTYSLRPAGVVGLGTPTAHEAYRTDPRAVDSDDTEHRCRECTETTETPTQAGAAAVGPKHTGGTLPAPSMMTLPAFDMHGMVPCWKKCTWWWGEGGGGVGGTVKLHAARRQCAEGSLGGR